MQPAYREHTKDAAYTASQSRNRRKKAHRRRRKAVLVMSVGVVILFVTALLVSILGKQKTEPNPASLSIGTPSQAAGERTEGQQSAAQSIAIPSMPELLTSPYAEKQQPALFNYNHAIPKNYTMNLKDIGNGQKMDERAAQAYNDMSAAAAKDGVKLVPLSGYRSHERQTSNYNASIQRYLDRGLSREEAVRRTEGYYAIPGTSEHEAGVAIDIGDAKAPSANIQESFKDTDAYEWLQKNCTTYGFILRYQAETFDITRIHYEPWHYRYVGTNHAEKIKEADLTLEQYILGDALKKK